MKRQHMLNLNLKCLDYYVANEMIYKTKYTSVSCTTKSDRVFLVKFPTNNYLHGPETYFSILQAP